MKNNNIAKGMLLLMPAFVPSYAATVPPKDSVLTQSDSTATLNGRELKTVSVVRRKNGMMRMSGAMNGNIISKDELFKAACCNLGESFTTNPSVDLNYSDAATGAKQIKLLGLNGSYVQMLTENLPDFRGSAMPYSLGYIPGTWMKSIQVSKGAASVKNGYEGLTGQINVEYLKPEDEQGASVNMYGNTDGKFEANAEGNVHLSKKWFTNILTHYENQWGSHDMNHDGFSDMPNVRQYNLQNRWLYKDSRYIMHAGISLINEDRRSGQTFGHLSDEMKQEMSNQPQYKIGVKTNRYEGYMKHAFILNPEHGTNIALMANADMQQLDAGYGYKSYYVNEKNLYAQLMFEHNFNEFHNISTGVSLVYDYLGQLYNMQNVQNVERQRLNEKETVPGAYAQYTYNLHNKLIAMAGLRVDHSSEYGTFVTPRFHIKWQPASFVSLRLSAGKAYRSPHILAENNYLMASSRQLVIGNKHMEEAWNMGASSQFTFSIANKPLTLNAEYYYTRFSHQTVVDFDSDVHQVRIGDQAGLAYSHVFQIDATYPVLKGLTLTAAYRRNYVRENYNGVRMEKPLQSRYKGLVTASYKTPLGLWQADATLQLNGGGRMPQPYTLADGTQSWNSSFKAYPMLNLQVTRWFRHFSIYAGGENLTNKRQKNAVIDSMNPWGQQFDTNMVWGPVNGAMGYIGIRINFGRLQ